MDFTLIGLIVLVVLNILGWIFAAGKMTGVANTRLNNLEKKVNEPQMLPECRKIFDDLNKGLAQLSGEVQAMLIAIKESQKNNERRHTRNEK